MNIAVQVCGIVTLCVMIFYYQNLKRLQLDTGKAFLLMWYVSLFNLILDILSLVCIELAEHLPQILVYGSCKVYIASLIWVGTFGALYLCTDIFEDKKNYATAQKIYIIVSSVGTLAVLIAPLYIYNQNEQTIYTYGPGANIAYAVAASVICSMVVMLCVKRKSMNARKRNAIILWLGIWALAAIIQMIFREVLVVGYAGALGVLVIYLRMENPENNIDRESGLFNQSAFMQYIQQKFAKGEEVQLLSVTYTRSKYVNQGSMAERKILAEVTEYIAKIEQASVFKCVENSVFLTFHSKEHAQKAIEQLKERFSQAWGKEGNVLNPFYIYMPDINVVREPEDVLSLLNYIWQQNRDASESSFISVNESIVNGMYAEIEVEQLIMSAMDDKRVEVFYQPIYSTDAEKFITAEALVRIRREDGSYILPGAFIEVAEQKGLILRLGEMVFESVCRFIHENDIRRLGMSYIEVNLSVIQCGYENLADDFIGIMNKYQVNPAYINLEITESASLQNKSVLLGNMEKLRRYGVGFSLDDFGTGQSNLNYIVDMPVDNVKFDKGMTQAYFEREKVKYVMNAAMFMIKGLELKIVSEGIETETQFNIMKDLGIQYIQGYYFSKPLPEKDFIKFIRERNIIGK